MPILYYLGASDVYRIEEPRPVGFHRADDEPHPYAHVDQEAASAILAAHPDLFRLKEASTGKQEAKAIKADDPLTVADLDAAVEKAAPKKPGRKAKAKE